MITYLKLIHESAVELNLGQDSISLQSLLVFQFYQASANILKARREVQIEACIHRTVKLLNKICSSIPS